MATPRDDFVHLHNHTNCSLLDGVSAIPDLVARGVELGMDAMAITDHGNMYGAIEFYQECQENSIKPIIGCELYMAAGDSVSQHVAEDRNSTHLVVIAQDNAGYTNLMRLVTFANTEGFYRYPRVDHDTLAQHADGLAVLSGCASSEVSKLIADRHNREAAELVQKYADMFPGRYWLELQEHTGVPQLAAINAGLVELSQRLNLPLIGTNDCHYIYEGQSRIQDIKICIQTGRTINDTDRLKMTDSGYYLKSGLEMRQLEIFQKYPVALHNTRSLADECALELEFGRTRMPTPQVPPGETADAYLARLCWAGLPQRYPDNAAAARARVERELHVIRATGFAPYFLAVREITAEARRRNIRFGVRGSAAASIVLYCLEITGIDPLAYDLVFERFLNLERKEMPDIDMDFPEEARADMAEFVKNRYGEDRVAQIVGFNELRTKGAVRDTGRAMGIALPKVDRAARLIPQKAATLEQARAASPPLESMCRDDPEIRELFERAAELVGIKRAVNRHPAGILISDEPIINLSPLERSGVKESANALLTTQYSMDQVAKLGLIKMDFLGLATLSILNEAENLIRSKSPDFTLEELPKDDPATYALLATGNTSNVFQLESEGMQQYLRELLPESIDEIAAITALYRPGPMEHAGRFIDGKHGRIAIEYPHPSMSEVLDPTYGVIVYQDQVLKIMQEFAGYSLGKADIVRKAMGKKIPELMRKERQNFIAGAMRQGHDEASAHGVFNLIEPFAGYAFNKAHAVSYAMLAYWTGYCKANYPVEYMTAALNARRGNATVYLPTLAEALRMGIAIAGPSITQGKARCDIVAPSSPEVAPAIQLGLAHVKGVGIGRIERFLQLRDEAKETWDRVEAAFGSAAVHELGMSAALALAKSGAFDELGPRRAVVDNLDTLWEISQRRAKGAPTMQQAMIPMADPEVPGVIDLTCPEYTNRELRSLEEESLGIAITTGDASVVDLAQAAAARECFHTLSEVRQSTPGVTAGVVGRISRVRDGVTKSGKPYKRVQLTLTDDELEVMVWSETLSKAPSSAWELGNVLAVHGEIQEQRERWSMSCRSLAVIDAAERPAAQYVASLTSLEPGLRFRLEVGADPVEALGRLRYAIRTAMEFPGTRPLVAEILHPDQRVELVEVGCVKVVSNDPRAERLIQEAARRSPDREEQCV